MLRLACSVALRIASGTSRALPRHGRRGLAIAHHDERGKAEAPPPFTTWRRG